MGREKLSWRWRTACCSVGIPNSSNVTREVLEKTAGSWNSSMLYRRPAFSLLDAVYRAKQGWLPDAFRRTPWRIKEGVILCVAMAPFMRENIRSPVGSTIYATDANPTTNNIAYTIIPGNIVREWHFRADIRGCRTWLKPESIVLRSKIGDQVFRTLDGREQVFSELTCACKREHLFK